MENVVVLPYECELCSKGWLLKEISRLLSDAGEYRAIVTRAAVAGREEQWGKENTKNIKNYFHLMKIYCRVSLNAHYPQINENESDGKWRKLSYAFD